MDRRQFIKSIGLAGAGIAVTALPVLDKPTKNLSELAHFNNGALSRNADGFWWLTFTSSEKFDPSGEKNLIVELGKFKWQLNEIKDTKVSWLDEKYHYILSGNEWHNVTSD